MSVFKGKEYSLYDLNFVILWEWHKYNLDKDTLIKLLDKHTPMTEEECVDWVVELRPPDIQEWSETELGKQIINSK